MGERRALVIASQCEGLNLLSFLPGAAREMAQTLLDPSIGGCVPALPGTALLVDPTVTELDSAISEAFDRASEDEATLFIALVGHGEYTYNDFYFLVRDTALPPTSRTAFLLAQRIRELLAQYSLLDGLVLLLDTCHAGIAAQQAGNRWIQIVGQAGRRFEVLTASDDRTAANGCFSRQLVQVLRSGHPDLGERLRCPDMKAVLAGLCPAQTAVHLAFDGRREIAAGDEGLWLARNTSEAWRSSLAADNPAADLIDRLTRDFVPPQQLRTLVGHLMMGTRTISVSGPAGKSRLMAALARPSVAPEFLPPKLMDAVIFVSPADSVERVATELARQLGNSVPGFREASQAFESATDSAAWELADAFERLVAGPLRTSQARVRIAVDGLDHLPAPVRDRLWHALDSLPGAQIVVASRQPLTTEATVELSPLPVFEQPDGSKGPVTPGGLPPFPVRDDSPTSLVDLLNATGKTPVPTTVLVAASGMPLSAVRDFIVRSSLIRLEPGTSRETVARATDSPPASPEAHSAIADALLALAPLADRASRSPEQIYADAALAEHLWHAGRHTEALTCLEDRPSAIPAENRATWELWSHRFPPSSRLGIIAQARHLTAVGKCGDRSKALALFHELQPLAERVLPPDDPELFSIRNNIGYLLFELDDFAESERRLRSLIDDATTGLGVSHKETLHARHMLAIVVGKLGDSVESAQLSQDLIGDAESVLGQDHQVTINARLNYHFHGTHERQSKRYADNYRRLTEYVAGLPDDDPRAVEVGVFLHWDDPVQLRHFVDRSRRLYGRDDHPETLRIQARARELDDRA